jgi:hypothetical protein
MAPNFRLVATVLLATIAPGAHALTQRVKAQRAFDSDAAGVGVLYAVMTNNKPQYQEKLKAQLDTWAADPLAQGRFVAVTGVSVDHPPPADVPGLFLSTCDDAYRGVPCKEERLMEIGASKGAEWLVILGEDNYVDTKALEQRLAYAKSSTPTVLGLVGERQNTEFCPEASEQLFGGGGYALNKAALGVLLSKGQDALREEYGSDTGLQGDLATSCALVRRGVSLTELPGLVGVRITAKQSLQALMQKKPFTYHYMTPGAMRWVHAQVHQRSAEELLALEQTAFTNGCCCGDGAPKALQQCEARSAALAQENGQDDVNSEKTQQRSEDGATADADDAGGVPTTDADAI